MSSLTIELPPQQEQTAFNLRRWAKLLADPALQQVTGRIETDRYGHVLMSPPPGSTHGRYQTRIAILLDRLRGDAVITECPISTADGVRAVDVAWASTKRRREIGKNDVFLRAPEICVEVLSPQNSAREMEEKAALYFDAGAQEVWLCSIEGEMTFFIDGEMTASRASKLCPSFPKQISFR
jgi:Uma2 family endonuclease